VEEQPFRHRETPKGARERVFQEGASPLQRRRSCREKKEEKREETTSLKDTVSGCKGMTRTGGFCYSRDSKNRPN
jgi:hypothetical protein